MKVELKDMTIEGSPEELVKFLSLKRDSDRFVEQLNVGRHQALSATTSGATAKSVAVGAYV